MQLLERGIHADPQLDHGDHFVTDHGNDAVGLDRVGRRGSDLAPESGKEEGKKEEQAVESDGHGRHCGMSRALEVGNSLDLP